ncbi:mobile element transfer protein [Streptomyces sp. NPDC050738]|uniref:mobile element transfer protein n=1 Tax=Streptomyces sp. NPDC050738 TaxID=3154744 RepID=UPI00344958C8
MPHGFLFQRLMRYGPVEIGTGLNREGKKSYLATCTSNACGWSSDFATYSACCMAAKSHRCYPR